MKQVLYIVLILTQLSVYAQPNCLVYKDNPHIIACELCGKAFTLEQGSRASQELFIYSLNACPTFAPSLHEMSVPYLKRGDFYTWKLLMDKAVAADPESYLGDRGWCLFKFLRDYENAYKDLDKLHLSTLGYSRYAGDGDYDLRTIMALCQRNMKNYKLSLQIFDECIQSNEKHGMVGLFDYLHRGVTKLIAKDYAGAIADLKKETGVYVKLADTYYYLGKSYLKINDNKSAIMNFKKARQLFTSTGYHRSDSYCEEPDQVYLIDIDNSLKSLK